RAVGCQIVSSPVKTFLALEWLQPGESEDKAALRLLDKLPELYDQDAIHGCATQGWSGGRVYDALHC
ncbi:MAG: hypothetical protein ACR2NN_16505, partial [Bryobacteraceae bacterium]